MFVIVKISHIILKKTLKSLGLEELGLFSRLKKYFFSYISTFFINF